jgi:hypothetical protein
MGGAKHAPDSRRRMLLVGGLLFLLAAALAPTARGRASGAALAPRAPTGAFWARGGRGGGSSRVKAFVASTLWGVRGGADNKARDDEEDGTGGSKPAAG